MREHVPNAASRIPSLVNFLVAIGCLCCLCCAAPDAAAQTGLASQAGRPFEARNRPDQADQRSQPDQQPDQEAPPPRLQDQSFTLDAKVTFYGDDTEFRNPFREGETVLGTFASIFVEAKLSDRLALRGGVFANQRFGSDDGFDEVRPVLSLVIGGSRSRLILGTLETVRRSDGPGPDRTSPHGLLPPVQIETLAFERPWEAGMQWLVETERVRQDAWINWQRINTTEQREIFDAGLVSRIRLRDALAVHGDVHIVHQGGQLSANGPVGDSYAATLGMEAASAVAPFDRLSVEGYVLVSRDVPNREVLSDARTGLGTFVRAAAEKSRWRGHIILWRGSDFIKREGDPLYQTVRRDGTRMRGLRDYAEAGLTRVFPLAPRSWLEASARYHRTESANEYSFRILAVAQLRTRLTK